MGKKVNHQVGPISPRKEASIKKADRNHMDIQNPQSLINVNIYVYSVGFKQLQYDELIKQLKKISNTNGTPGSGKTEDNPKLQQERKNTFVNDFNFPQGKIQMDVSNGSGSGGSGKKTDEQINDDSDDHNKLMRKDSEYIKFFKFYYEKNKITHPQWTAQQITTIVSLMWKKKKMTDKMPVKLQTSTIRRSNKPLSGKDAFKMEHKELSKMEIDQLWTKLPQQSKNFWKKQGQSYGNISKNSNSDSASTKNSIVQNNCFDAMRTLLNNS